MIEVSLQIQPGHNGLSPFSEEDKALLKAYKPNQVVRAKIKGCRRLRSIQQNRWLHAIFREVAANSQDVDWDTPEKVKLNVKMRMKFFKDAVVVGAEVSPHPDSGTNKGKLTRNSADGQQRPRVAKYNWSVHSEQRARMGNHVMFLR